MVLNKIVCCILEAGPKNLGITLNNVLIPIPNVRFFFSYSKQCRDFNFLAPNCGLSYAC